MNSKKYKDTLYNMRYINDLRDMIVSSAELYAEDPAFLVKDTHSDPYRPITFRSLREDIDSLGTKLTALGLRDKKVALIGENSYEWVVSYFAVVNGTGVIVPLDKDLPEGEVTNLLNRSEADAVIFSGKQKKKIMKAMENCSSVSIMINMDPAEEEPGIYRWRSLLEYGRELVANGDRRFINAVIDREAMCSLLFTSGTTGRSKGVMLSHKNLSANVYNMSKYVKIRRPGRGLSILPMHHTYELTCHIFTGLYQGMAVAICEGLRYIQQNLKESQATVMVAVPIIFESMHKKIWKQAESSGSAGKLRRMLELSRRTKLFNNQKLMRKLFARVHQSIGNNVRIFIAGGAAINPQVIKDYEALGIPMIQGYGMTENAPIIAVHKDCYSIAESVGIPMPGTEIKISEPDSSGVGEIICRGPSVMLGYYQDPEATAEAIRDGWLYTGDYGRFDDEGFLYICGRKKNVIVSKNGKNIFPEEIETLLMELPLIQEAVVYGAVEKKDGDITVKAEIFPDYEAVREEYGELPEEELKKIIRECIEEVNDSMPAYKRVKRIKLRDEEFEKTTTRKIKRTGGAVREEDD